ncbi:hypothetical protein ColTof3_06936 [Colletotrichum tofieldiae]|nr:hypothetical protein ColTof3_06936 [Colletotrichum tofieldiae]
MGKGWHDKKEGAKKGRGLQYRGRGPEADGIEKRVDSRARGRAREGDGTMQYGHGGAGPGDEGWAQREQSAPDSGTSGGRAHGETERQRPETRDQRPEPLGEETGEDDGGGSEKSAAKHTPNDGCLRRPGSSPPAV